MPARSKNEEESRSGATIRAGIVGLGTIGRGIALSLGRSGRTASVFDIRKEAAEGLPVVWCDSAGEVARSSDVVFISVVDERQVAEAITGPNGVLSGAHPDLTIAVTATVSVQSVLGLVDVCERQGATVIDCGVTGGQRAAENGLIALVGGPDDVVRRIRPVLDDFTAEVFHCGPLGMGMATKIARNAINYGCWRAVHEGAETAVAAGVDRAAFVDVIERSYPRGRDARLSLQKLRMAGRTVDDASITVQTYLRNMKKDLQAAQQLGMMTGTATPLIDVALTEAADTFAWLDALTS